MVAGSSNAREQILYLQDPAAHGVPFAVAEPQKVEWRSPVSGPEVESVRKSSSTPAASRHTAPSRRVLGVDDRRLPGSEGHRHRRRHSHPSPCITGHSRRRRGAGDPHPVARARSVHTPPRPGTSRSPAGSSGSPAIDRPVATAERVRTTSPAAAPRAVDGVPPVKPEAADNAGDPLAGSGSNQQSRNARPPPAGLASSPSHTSPKRNRFVSTNAPPRPAGETGHLEVGHRQDVRGGRGAVDDPELAGAVGGTPSPRKTRSSTAGELRRAPQHPQAAPEWAHRD